MDRIALDAVLERVGDWEDAKIAEQRWRNDNSVYIPLEEVVRKYEARDAVERRKTPAVE
jgi:hypothetical protein